MIEMLGVLAIIGVLSVGGIVGYSKAMMKYKINKTVDQITTIVANTRTLFASQKKYTGLGTDNDSVNYALIKKAHLFPDDMYTGSGASDVENAFGGKVELTTSGRKVHRDDKAFTLLLRDIPEEACIELLSMDWGSGSSAGLIAVGKMISGVYEPCDGRNNSNASACPNGKTVAVPMPVSVAATACNGSDTLSPSGTNTLMWKFY